jgi:RNA polymerase sigma factor (sigma-70 family)
MHNDCSDSNMEELWVLFKTGNKPAFEKIIKAHYQTLFNYGMRFCKDNELIKDTLQDLFVTLWQNREGIGNTMSVKNYLLKSLRRKLLREVNKNKRTTYLSELHFNAGFNMVLPVDHNVILQEKLTELSFKVRGVLEKLSPRQQEILYLRFYMDANLDEIAEIMELNPQSVYNLLHESLKRFKGLSSPDYFSISLSLLLFLAFTS